MVSKNDQYETPASVFNTLDREFWFGHDVCAEHATAKCPTYWTAEDDALQKDWVSDSNLAFGKWLWCNPPYSGIRPWVEKAANAQRRGVGCVMLVMCDPSVGWFSEALKSVSEIRFITGGRLSFLQDGKPVRGNNKGSMILVFDPCRIGWKQTAYIDRSYYFREEFCK